MGRRESRPTRSLEPLSRYARGGPRARCARARDARRGRDQADARRHGLVPRAQALAPEDDAGRRDGADRGGAPAQGLRASSSTRRTSPTRRRRSRRGATALAHGVLDPLDAGTIAVMKSRPVFYIPTMDIFEFLADTRAFVDGSALRPAGRGSRDCRRRSVSERYRSRRIRGGIPRALSQLRERAPASAGACGRTSSACTPPEYRSRSAPTCGPSRDSASRSRWTCTSRPASPHSRRSGRRRRLPRARSASRRTAARSSPASGPTSSSSTANPLADVKNVRSIDGIYKAGARVGPIGRKPRAAENPDPLLALSPGVPDSREDDLPDLQLARGDAAGRRRRASRSTPGRGPSGASAPGPTRGGTCRSRSGDEIAPLLGAPAGSVSMLPNVTIASAVAMSSLDYARPRNGS